MSPAGGLLEFIFFDIGFWSCRFGRIDRFFKRLQKEGEKITG